MRLLIIARHLVALIALLIIFYTFSWARAASYGFSGFHIDVTTICLYLFSLYTWFFINPTFSLISASLLAHTTLAYDYAYIASDSLHLLIGFIILIAIFIGRSNIRTKFWDIDPDAFRPNWTIFTKSSYWVYSHQFSPKRQLIHSILILGLTIMAIHVLNRSRIMVPYITQERNRIVEKWGSIISKSFIEGDIYRANLPVNEVSKKEYEKYFNAMHKRGLVVNRYLLYTKSSKYILFEIFKSNNPATDRQPVPGAMWFEQVLLNDGSYKHGGFLSDGEKIAINESKGKTLVYSRYQGDHYRDTYPIFVSNADIDIIQSNDESRIYLHINDQGPLK